MVPRYGPDVLGGAEALVRALATTVMPSGWESTVATTCATDHRTWRNVHPAGEVEMDGLCVHRFPVGPRDPDTYERLHPTILSGRASYATELEWFSHSVVSTEMTRFLETTLDRFDLRIFAPYLFGTTLWGAQVAPGRSVLLPCLHDEAYARLTSVRAMLGAVRGCLFNAPGEARLAATLADVRDGEVVGMGFDPVIAPVAGTTARPDGPYLVYAGRLEEGKGVHELVDHVTRMREADPALPRLLLLGHGGYRPPRSARQHVVQVGFVPEADKQWLIAGATALVSASVMESLSIVQLEAWLHGVPSIVNARCTVMADHCSTSNGGLAYEDGAGFIDAVRVLQDDPARRQRMGASGREYVLDVYGWDAVRRRFRDAMERFAA